MSGHDWLFLLALIGGPVVISIIIIIPPLVRLAGEFLGVTPRNGRRPLI